MRRSDTSVPIPETSDYSCDVNGNVYGIHGDRLTPQDVNGVRVVTIRINGVYRRKTVAQCMVSAFLGIPFASINLCHHVSGDMKDDSIWNLAYRRKRGSEAIVLKDALAHWGRLRDFVANR